jgi:hypothetical protein
MYLFSFAKATKNCPIRTLRTHWMKWLGCGLDNQDSTPGTGIEDRNAIVSCGWLTVVATHSSVCVVYGGCYCHAWDFVSFFTGNCGILQTFARLQAWCYLSDSWPRVLQITTAVCWEGLRTKARMLPGKWTAVLNIQYFWSHVLNQVYFHLS